MIPLFLTDTKNSDNQIKKDEPKDDIKKIGSKDDIKNIGSKDDIKKIGSKDDIKKIGSKDGIKKIESKDGIKKIGSKDGIKKIGSKDDSEKSGPTEPKDQKKSGFFGSLFGSSKDKDKKSGPKDDKEEKGIPVKAEDVSTDIKEKLKTVPYDPRFPNQNQTRNCYQNYLDYHRCLKVKNESHCHYYWWAYHELCPKAWVCTSSHCK